jgi:glycosyltransferase involved in cell wall biosynthesis
LNNDDLTLFVVNKLVSQTAADRLPGIGVDIDRFAPIPLPDKAALRFLLIARMLWDKGIGEFVEAARILKGQGLHAEFCLLGFLDVQNPAAISHQQMDEWVEEGVIQYLGVSDNVAEEIALADCVVLPSYREGVPRTLLEAAAMARPIVTTDSIGCRDVVDDSVSGYLCQPRDAVDLADKISKIVALSHAERTAMGLRGRKKMEREFDEQIVIDKYLGAIKEILNHSKLLPVK